MKYSQCSENTVYFLSHPTRGGWIEIFCVAHLCVYASGPTPHGVGGLKSRCICILRVRECPTPHGVGGLKFYLQHDIAVALPSHPTRGGWIEMPSCALAMVPATVPPHTGWVDGNDGWIR